MLFWGWISNVRFRPEAVAGVQPDPAAVTCPSLSSRISTCRNYLNCKDRPRPVHRRRALRYELYPPRARSNCLHERKKVRHPRQRPVLDDLSHTGALRVQSQSVPVGLVPKSDADRRADRRNAGSGIRTDRADRIDPEVGKVSRQRDDARPACPAPPDTRSSHSESLPNDTVRRAASRLFLQKVE